MASLNSTQALALLGRVIDVVECIPMPYGPDFSRYRATVMAVQVPAPGTDIEWSLLLHMEGFAPDQMEYIELDRLHWDGELSNVIRA